MNQRRLLLILAAWCVLVIGPGAWASRGLDTDSDIGGSVVLLWIGGYLAQFFVFMVLMRMVKKNTKFLPWLVASMLPWLVDWTLPVSWLLLAPWILVAVGTAAWLYTGYERDLDLQQHGIPAVATVLKVIQPRFFNTVINNVYIKRKLRLRIERSDGTPAYEAVMHGTFMLGEIPSEGSTMNLRVDPKNPHHFDYAAAGDDDAPTTSYDSPRSADDSPDTSGASDFTAQLERLTTLHKSGGLTDAEFTKAKERLLNLG